MVADRSLVLLALLALCGAASCRNTVGDEADAGVIGAEGEGEGDVGEGEGEGGEGEGECASGPVIGLIVLVKDDLTQFPLCNASILITEAPYTETLTPRGADPDCDYFGATDRPGTYAIEVSATDYQTRSLLDVEVTGDSCGHAQLRRVAINLPPT